MSQVPPLSQCPHCRAELPEHGSFCNACGRRVEGWKKPPVGEAAAAASSTVEPESATRRMEPTPSLLRAASVAAQKAAPEPESAAQSDSSVMRAVQTRRTPVVVGAIAILAVAAGLGAYRLLRRVPTPPVRPTQPVAAPAPAMPGVPVVNAKPGRRRAHRAEPVQVDEGKATKLVGRASDVMPKKTVVTDSRPLPSSKAAPSPSPSQSQQKVSAPIVPPEDLPADSTPLTEAERAQQAEASIDADGVRFVIKSHISQVHACYSRFFKDSSPGGRVDLGFVINKDGHATRAKAEANTTGSAEVAGCLETRIKEWDFPRPVGGDYELVYPFVFAAGS